MVRQASSPANAEAGRNSGVWEKDEDAGLELLHQRCDLVKKHKVRIHLPDSGVQDQRGH